MKNAATETVKAVLFLLCIVTALAAGINKWTYVGPDGGRCGTMSIDTTDTNVLWVSHNCPMKTTDCGKTWVATNNGIPWYSGMPQFCGITMSPSNHNIIIAHG